MMKFWKLLPLLWISLIISCSNSKNILFDQSIQSPNQNSRIKYIILHYTVSNFKSTIDIFTNNTNSPKNVSAHYVIPEPLDNSYHYKKLKVFKLVKDCQRSWHAGVSAWKGSNGLNDQSIGIEMVNQTDCKSIGEQDYFYYADFDPQQIQLLIETLNQLMRKYPHIHPTNIIAHSDIAPGRKMDPGPKFPWELLYRYGHGAWFDYNVMLKYAEKFSQEGLPSIAVLQQALKCYGYAVQIHGLFDQQTSQVVSAFQRHFVQDNVTGIMDIKTSAILFALLEKYYPDWVPETSNNYEGQLTIKK
ncbi:MAG: N-acetylmuramoyl-L-alanine amidase [Candidatus Symbiodolus clandestinus]